MPRSMARSGRRGAASRSGALALFCVLVAPVVATGCQPPPAAVDPSESLAGSVPPGSAMPSRPASGEPGNSPSATPTAQAGEPLSLNLDPALEASLPTALGPVRFVRHSLRTGEPPPSGFSSSLGHSLLRAAGSSAGRISVAWIDPVPEQAQAAFGMTLVAIRIPGAEARRLRLLAAVEAVLEPGASGWIESVSEAGWMVIVAGDTLVMSAGDTLYVVSYPAYDPAATPPPSSGELLSVSEEDLIAALPPLDGEFEAEPTSSWPPPPTFGPGASPEPDPAVEALLPDRIRGVDVQKVSASGSGLRTSDLLYVALPLYALGLGGLDLDFEDLAAAGGHPRGLSTFWIVAAPVSGYDDRQILAAWFTRLLGSLGEFETVEAGGRLAIVHGNQAVHVRDGVLYWMTYLDVGDFPPSSPPPRPALRELVVDTLRALP